jgi:hypothetical protein
MGPGLIVHIQAIAKCKTYDKDDFHRNVLTSLKCIIFFGTPHRGMDTVDIENYLGSVFSEKPTGDFRKFLVAELKRDNPTAARELQDFKDLIGRDVKARIISVYERKASRRPVEGKEIWTGATSSSGGSSKWTREGEFYHPLLESSALLGFPSWMESRISSESDHSNMAKFDQKDQTYLELLHEFKGICSIRHELLDNQDSTYKIARSAESTKTYQDPEWIPFDSLYFPEDQTELIEVIRIGCGISLKLFRSRNQILSN